MDSFQTLRALLGWCTAINLGLLLAAAAATLVARDGLKRIHSRLLGLSGEDLDRAYFRYLASYKTLVLVFNLVPYLAMHLMA